jgi:hypothetical protein
MTTIRYFVPTATAALVIAACAGNALAGGDNAATYWRDTFTVLCASARA